MQASIVKVVPQSPTGVGSAQAPGQPSRCYIHELGGRLPLLSPRFAVTSIQLSTMSFFIVQFSLEFTVHNSQKSADTEKTNVMDDYLLLPYYKH